MAPAGRAIVQQRRISIPGFAHFPQQPGWRHEPWPVPVPEPFPAASPSPLTSNHSIILYYHSLPSRGDVHGLPIKSRHSAITVEPASGLANKNEFGRCALFAFGDSAAVRASGDPGWIVAVNLNVKS
jgi:hypothetical protein